MLKATLDRLAARIALVMTVALLGLAGTGFLLASLYLWLAETSTLPLAAFLTGVIALIAAAIPVVANRLRGRPDRKRTISSDDGEQMATKPPDAALLAGAIGAEMGSWVAKNSRAAAVGALLTGIVFGASPRARSELRSLIETIASGWKSPG